MQSVNFGFAKEVNEIYHEFLLESEVYSVNFVNFAWPTGRVTSGRKGPSCLALQRKPS